MYPLFRVAKSQVQLEILCNTNEEKTTGDSESTGLKPSEKVRNLQKKIQSIVNSSKSIVQDESLHSDLMDIIEEFEPEMEKLPRNDAKRVFWSAQVCNYVHVAIYVVFNIVTFCVTV